MTRKLVSVVTGTWERHDLLLDAIENVRQQTYRPLEHVIVADGPDDILSSLFSVEDEHRWADDGTEDDRWVPIRFVELGFHSSSVLRDSISAAPFMVAQLLARGDYQTWLADDERMLVPDHIEQLVNLLEEYDADFAYPQVEMWWEGHPERTSVIGTNPPQNGQFTHCLYRRDALDKGMLFRTHVGSGTDWDAVARTMAHHQHVPGASASTRWVFNRQVTLSHRVDKVLLVGLFLGLLLRMVCDVFPG